MISLLLSSTRAPPFLYTCSSFPLHVLLLSSTRAPEFAPLGSPCCRAYFACKHPLNTDHLQPGYSSADCKVHKSNRMPASVSLHN
jgi:hypothetical protein